MSMSPMMRKHLDFADVSLNMSTLSTPPRTTLSEGNDTFEESLARTGSVVDASEDCSVEELRQEAQHLRERLSTLNASSVLNHPFLHKLTVNSEEVNADEISVKQLEDLFSTLKAEYLELSEKEYLLKMLAQWQIGDEQNEVDNWLTDETEIANMRQELSAQKSANAETASEMDNLIKDIVNVVDQAIKPTISAGFSCLADLDLDVDKLAEEGTEAWLDNQDLETVHHLEEQLKQNERDYEEAEAEMKRKMDQYDIEMRELEAQAQQLNREEECLRKLVDVSAGLLKTQKHMECSNDVSIISVEDGYIELQLTTFVPAMDDLENATEKGSDPVWEHKLHINVNQETMEIKEAKLIPGDVDIHDRLIAAQGRRYCTRPEDSTYFPRSQPSTVCHPGDFLITTRSIETADEGELAVFGRQLAFLVRAVHQRITIYAFKRASISIASNDPRYCVDYLPGNSTISVTKPGKLKALVEVPQDWPMHGHPLRLQSLDLLDTDSQDGVTSNAMQKALAAVNQMPEYVCHDLLTFMEAVDKIVSQ